MKEYFSDYHIHIGRTGSGKPVKITGSKTLTLENILYTAAEIKGMDMIGIIDCHVPEVLMEMEELIGSGEMQPLDGGGIQYHQKTTLIPGSELEINDENCQGPIHVLAYFPELSKMKEFSSWMAPRMKNITLSSQRIYATATEVQRKVKELDGLFIPAHVFTPFKSVYGKGVKSSLSEVLDPEMIDAIELGLSSDTMMADAIPELHNYPYVSNSDAHSLEKIAREYQLIEMVAPTFNELRMALRSENGRFIKGNYGLNPLLGKYHETVCEKCGSREFDNKGACGSCGSDRVVRGVSERINELSRLGEKSSPPTRPPYVHQVPLEFIPKLGPKTLQKLRDHFQTDMNILHYVPEEAIATVAGKSIANRIIQARNGELSVDSGGGGIYGKVRP